MTRRMRFWPKPKNEDFGDFLENPQNLIMLWRAVLTGSWPATRKELFELSTKLMLQEFDQDRARSGSGVYSVAELRPVAGAICAARLISDVDAISLTDQEGTPDTPGYRSLAFLELEKIQAALGRRIFVAGPEPETVDYAHRTTAEYLAAAFLSARIREGLPLGRVTALIGVDGHPAPELRGLHAWLAVHLPECADHLIEADPYGVLTYGDAASLAPSSCVWLVRALDRLSKSNPWFRSGNWQSRSIGALARPDMVREFRDVLNNPDAGFGLRSVVVDALSLGTPIPEMLPDLAEILAREASPYAERLSALAALLRLGDAGKAAIMDVFQTRLARSANDLRLRAEIVERLYGEPFGAADVVVVVNDTLEAQHGNATNTLWGLADNMPLADIPDVLDGVMAPNDDETGFDRTAWEAGHFYVRILVRAWRASGEFDAGRALNWLRKCFILKGADSQTRARNLRLALSETPERVRAVADYFLRTMPMDEHRWLALHRFRETILFQVSPAEMLDLIVEHLAAATDNGERQLFFYEAAFRLSYQAEQPHSRDVFERLYTLAESKPLLEKVRERVVASTLPDNYLSGPRPATELDVEKLRRDFERDVEQIQSGAHLEWLGIIGLMYFALFNDIESATSPRERLVAMLGEANAETALAGLCATLSRSDVPTFADVMALAVEERQHYDWWYALVAGMNERWAASKGFDELSEDLLRALLAFDLVNPVSSFQDGTVRWLVHPWRAALVEQRPDLAHDVFLAIARLRFSKHEQFVDGLHELLTETAFEPYRKATVLDLLHDFPNAGLIYLGKLLDAAAKLPEVHADFLALAGQALSGAVAVDERQRDMWLATAYLLAPTQYEDEVENRGRARPAFVFDLRDRCGFAHHGLLVDRALPLPMLEFMTRLTGMLFPETPPPSTVCTGDTNAWDAAEYCRNLINMISALPARAATDALARLEANPDLSSYRQHVLYALANQRQRQRDAEYDRPDWPQTVEALANGAPATVADLHALLVAHLRDLKERIERENTDLYKQFWNLDHHAKPTEPRPEEACRVVTLMRHALLPLSITVEPEAHMVADKRADISVAMPGRKILCELKRDHHVEVWTAMERQLERFYTHDPAAKGFGVYCIFWFGDKRRPMPTPPNGLNRPQSAREMEQMLKGLFPSGATNRIAAIVIDVSGVV